MPASQYPHPSAGRKDREQCYGQEPTAKTARSSEGDFAHAPVDVGEDDAQLQQQQMQRRLHLRRNGFAASWGGVFEYPVIERDERRTDERYQEDHPAPAPPVGFAVDVEMNGNSFGQARVNAQCDPPTQNQNDYS